LKVWKKGFFVLQTIVETRVEKRAEGAAAWLGLVRPVATRKARGFRLAIALDHRATPASVDRTSNPRR
jgi:hypothetical protein